MGKQIRFFMLGQDEVKFLEAVEGFGDTIVDDKLQSFSAIDLTSTSRTLLNIISQDSNISKSKSGYLDSLMSDAIEFSRSVVRNQDAVPYGRLWVELRYHNENGATVTKSTWLEDKFRAYRKWIKSYCRLSECKDFYIGETAYKMYKEEGFRMMATPSLEVKF